MKEYKDLTFKTLKEEDIKELMPIMTRAFDEDMKMHLNIEKGGPEGYDDGEFLRKWGLHKDSEAYIITRQGETVGALILWINRDTGINYLGNVFVDPKLQNLGIGARIWEFVEMEHPDTKKWCTETAIFSRRNHNFYVNKCGFHIVRIDDPKDIKDGSYYMEKVMI